MSLIVLRHGQSQWNHENRFCGWIDIDLTSKGQQEARHAGDLIAEANLRPHVLFTSKLQRSIFSGDIILRRLDRLWADHYKTWKLNERHYGSWQGRNKAEVLKEVGEDEYDYVRRNINGCPPLIDHPHDKSIDERYEGIFGDLPCGESLAMTIARVQPYYYQEIVPLLRSGKTVLVVTHGSIVRSFIKFLAGVSDDDISKVNVANGVPLVFKFCDDSFTHGNYQYLDPELAAKGAAKVRDEGKI